MKATRALSYFLTYPKCDIEPEDALYEIMVCSTVGIKDYLIAQEEHKDGTKHLHAYIKYDRKVKWGVNKWDLGDHHGNY